MAALLLATTGRVGAQSTVRAIKAETDFTKEQAGPTVLARLATACPVLVSGNPQKGRLSVTIQGWIAASALRDEKRDGFDVAVSLVAGTPLRGGPGSGATLGTAKGGALFERVTTRNGWVQVRRTGWVPADQVTAAQPAAQPPATQKAATPPPPPPAATPAAPPASPDAQGTSLATLLGGVAVHTAPNGLQLAVLETPFSAKVIETRNGWKRVQLDVWVRDDGVGSAATSGALTGEALRAEPERFVGATVEWTIQVLAIQKADELRPELPLDQPYVLARGPLPETGFVYLVITPAEVAAFREMEPLAKIKVAATVRAGRLRHLPTPVLNFVRRIN